MPLRSENTETETIHVGNDNLKGNQYTEQLEESSPHRENQQQTVLLSKQVSPQFYDTNAGKKEQKEAAQHNLQNPNNAASNTSQFHDNKTTTPEYHTVKEKEESNDQQYHQILKDIAHYVASNSNKQTVFSRTLFRGQLSNSTSATDKEYEALNSMVSSIEALTKGHGKKKSKKSSKK